VALARTLLGKLGWILPVTFGVVTVTFFVARVFTGDPTALYAPPDAGAELRTEIRENLGRDRWPEAGAAGPPVSPRVLRQHGPARDDRDGPDARAEPADPGRRPRYRVTPAVRTALNGMGARPRSRYRPSEDPMPDHSIPLVTAAGSRAATAGLLLTAGGTAPGGLG
jgi:hypothetical protein